MEKDAEEREKLVSQLHFKEEFHSVSRNFLLHSVLPCAGPGCQTKLLVKRCLSDHLKLVFCHCGGRAHLEGKYREGCGGVLDGKGL